MNGRIGPAGAAVLLLAQALLGGCDGEADRTELVIWDNMHPHERVILEEHLDRWNRAHPEAPASHVTFDTERLRTLFLTAAVGGGGPDLTYGPGDQVGPLSVAGVLAPLDEIFDAAYLGRFLPAAFDTVEGKVWALPARVGNHLTLLYNRDFLERPPATLEGMARTAARITRDRDGDGSPDIYGLAFNMKEPFWLVPFLGAYGGWVMDGERRPALDTPATARALRFVAEMASGGALPRDCGYELADALFKEGKAAMLINGPWSWGGYEESGIDFGIAPLPLCEETGLRPTPMISTFGYGMNANLRGGRRARTAELMRFLVSEEAQRDYARRIHVLPSLRALFEEIEEGEDERLLASIRQYRFGRPMPAVPEMRAIWDAMRPAWQNVLNGEAAPEEAARAMQRDAEEKIREMRGGE